MFLEWYELENEESRLILHGRGRYPAPYARLELVSRGILDYRLASEKTATTKPTVADRILTALDECEALTAVQIAHQVQAAVSTVRSLLQELIGRKTIALTTKVDRAARYTLCSKLRNDS